MKLAKVREDTTMLEFGFTLKVSKRVANCPKSPAVFVGVLFVEKGTIKGAFLVTTRAVEGDDGVPNVATAAVGVDAVITVTGNGVSRILGVANVPVYGTESDTVPVSAWTSAGSGSGNVPFVEKEGVMAAESTI